MSLIIGAEDEDFENDLHPPVDDHCAHFGSIELVKTHPTHLLVFLQHVMLQFDCAPLLCYLHADLFKGYSAKETKKQFLEFYNTFLDKGAILRVPVPFQVACDLDRTRPDLISDDAQKRCVQDVQKQVISEVLRQLEDFRTKRMMGMTRHEHELVEVENHRATERIPMEMKEKAMAELLLDKMFDVQPSVSIDEEKFTAIFGAVASYMKHLGVKAKTADNKKTKGFFKKIPRIPGIGRSEDSVKARQRFPGIWIPGGNEIKAKLDNEGDKDKATSERKGSMVPSLRSASQDPAPAFPHRKNTMPAVSASTQAIDTAEGPVVSISVTASPESPHTEPAGIASGRLEPSSVSEGGDVSPASAAGGVSIWESPPVSDAPPEESQEKDRMSQRLARSESLCVERRRSQRGNSARAKQSRSRSDVGLQAASSIAHPPSPSQPHTPLSDSATASSDGSLAGPVAGPSPPQEEVEPRLLELEQDPPNWREQAPSELLSSLSKKEIKRQEVINELFVTEHAHVRMLSVLQTVFFRPLDRLEIMTIPELNAIFPNLDEIFEMHYAFYENLKRLRQEDNFIVKSVGTTLLNRFKGAEGDWFQKLTARFCSHQSYALDLIKSRQKKDARFGSFIQEAEGKPQCRRLQLKDIIPTEMQRLTKYPLLLGNIAKTTEDTSEKEKIHEAAECCRKILNHVNEEVKEMENFLTLRDYQRRLDTSGLKPSNELYQEYKTIDLTQRRMIFEGPVNWKVTKEKSVDVQCVLLGDLLVLLQRQDDKMLLKCQSKSQSGVPEGKQMLSPIIKLGSVFLREVATDQKAFYVIFTWDSGAQIYELVANSGVERKNWTELIKSAVEELKQNGAPTFDKKRLGSLPPNMSGIPYSPTIPNAPLTLAENGSSVRNNSSEHDKFETKSGDPRHALMDFLSANGFELLCHSNAPQEKVASEAFEEVAGLRRLLEGSGVSAGGKNRDMPPDKQDLEMDNCQSATGAVGIDGKTEADRGDKEKEEGEEETGEAGAATGPVVLPPDRVTEALRHIHNLEQQLKRLQCVEEEHHRLQDILCKYSITRDGYQ